jgi:hypothetical protein
MQIFFIEGNNYDSAKNHAVGSSVCAPIGFETDKKETEGEGEGGPILPLHLPTDLITAVAPPTEDQ